MKWKPNATAAKGSGCALGWKKNINYYGYKNSIWIDAEQGFIRRFVVNPANIHDAYVWADSGERFQYLLSLAGYENRIHEKGSINHSLYAAATERYSIMSQIWARVEHKFGCFATSMRSKFTRKIGIKKIRNDGA